MSRYIFYRNDRLVFIGDVPDAALPRYESDGLSYISATPGITTPDGLYMVGGVPTPRPAQATVLTGAALSNLPAPCTITINGTDYDCTEDHADLTFDQLGTYKIKVTAWPYLDKEFAYENKTP